MELKLVIFDVDGLLLDTERVWKTAWQETAAALHLPIDAQEFDQLVGRNGRDYEEGLKKILGDQWDTKMFMAEMRRIGMKKLETELRLKPGAREILEYLKEERISRAVATATSRILTEERLNRMKIQSFFSCICCGDEICRRKPFPDIYLKVLETTGCSSKNALVLEDSPVGVEAAFRAQIPCIMIPDIIQPGLKERKRAEDIVESLFDAKKRIEERLCRV